MTDNPTRARAFTSSLVLFAYLQLLDLLTTVGFLVHGVKEGNPVVQYALMAAPTPFLGLVMVKIAALGIGIFCWRLGRWQLLQRINILFASLVSWNLWALIIAPV